MGNLAEAVETGFGDGGIGTCTMKDHIIALAQGGGQGASAATLGQGVVYRRLAPVALDGIDLFESVYPPGAASSIDGAMLVHAGYEMGSVVRGTLRFEFSEGTVELGPGGSLAFWATRPHRVVNASDDLPAAAIWLTLRDLSET